MYTSENSPLSIVNSMLLFFFLIEVTDLFVTLFKVHNISKNY